MVGLVIPNNHFIYRASQDVNEICKELYQKTQINGILYKRYYYSGESSILTSDSECVKFHLMRGYPIITDIPQKYIKNQFYFLPTIEPSFTYNALISDIHSRFNYDHPIFFIEINELFIELFVFSTFINNFNIINFYLNNLDILKKYKNSFLDKASKIIRISEQNKIAIPKPMQPTFCQKGINIWRIKNKKQCISFTSRQLDCLRLLVESYTAKEIGQRLKLSHRTVETHINNMKNKLGFNKNIDLIRYAIKNNVI